MSILGDGIAVLIVALLVAATGRALRSKWRRDIGLFDGSPEVVVRHEGGALRADLLVRLAVSRGYRLAENRPAADGTDDALAYELVFVRDDA